MRKKQDAEVNLAHEAEPAGQRQIRAAVLNLGHEEILPFLKRTSEVGSEKPLGVGAILTSTGDRPEG
jgi:hypothetical protein